MRVSIATIRTRRASQGHGVNVQLLVIQFHRSLVYANVNRFAVNVYVSCRPSAKGDGESVAGGDTARACALAIRSCVIAIASRQ
jgi:hypothetical protein